MSKLGFKKPSILDSIMNQAKKIGKPGLENSQSLSEMLIISKGKYKIFN